MSSPEKYYKILGITSNSSLEEIKNAYRRLSLQYHPDKTKSDKNGQRFKEITEAYQFLKSEQKKSGKITKENIENAHSEYWKYKNKKINEDFWFYQQRNFSDFMQSNNVNFENTSHNKEKPISQKITHFLLYGGLAIIAVWIVMTEFLK